MRLSLSLIFWNTQETTLIVATRGAISFNLQLKWVPDQNGPFLIYWVLGMFAEKKDDYSVFCSVVGQILLALVVPLSEFVALAVAKWDAEISGKTVFVKPDWDKLTEQRNSGDRAATSVFTRVFQVRCTRDTVKPLCVLSSVRGFANLEAGNSGSLGGPQRRQGFCFFESLRLKILHA